LSPPTAGTKHVGDYQSVDLLYSGRLEGIQQTKTGDRLENARKKYRRRSNRPR